MSFVLLNEYGILITESIWNFILILLIITPYCFMNMSMHNITLFRQKVYHYISHFLTTHNIATAFVQNTLFVIALLPIQRSTKIMCLICTQQVVLVNLHLIMKTLLVTRVVFCCLLHC